MEYLVVLAGHSPPQPLQQYPWNVANQGSSLKPLCWSFLGTGHVVMAGWLCG